VDRVRSCPICAEIAKLANLRAKTELFGLLLISLGIFLVWLSFVTFKGSFFSFSGPPQAEHPPFAAFVFGFVVSGGTTIFLKRQGKH